MVVEMGIIPLLIETLHDTSSHFIVQLAIRGISNLTLASNAYRDEIIKNQGIETLIWLIGSTQLQRLFSYCCRALSDLCKGTPLPSFSDVEDAVIELCECIAQESEDLPDENIIHMSNKNIPYPSIAKMMKCGSTCFFLYLRLRSQISR